MRIVISDTSPVRALANLGLLTLLQQLYDEVIVPRAVAVELSQPRDWQPVISLDDLAESRFLRVQIVGCDTVQSVASSATRPAPLVAGPVESASGS